MIISSEGCYRDGGIYSVELDVSGFVEAINMDSVEARVVELDLPLARGLSEDWAICDSDAKLVLNDDLFRENAIKFKAILEILGDTPDMRHEAVRTVSTIANYYGGKVIRRADSKKADKSGNYLSRVTYEFGKSRSLN